MTKTARRIVKYNNTAYTALQCARSRLFPPRAMNILFSETNDDWKTGLVEGFGPTDHTITFGDLTPDSVANYDLVVPLDIPELKKLVGMRSLIPNNPIPLPSMDVIEVCDDKYLFNQWLLENDFGKYVPQMGGSPGASRDIPLPYPYILKKRIGTWGGDAHIISDAQDAEAFAEKIADPDYFCQEIVRGTAEYTTHILFKGGKIVRSLSIEYVFPSETPIKGVNDSTYLRVCRCPYLREFASILTAIGYDGLCCFNYKIADGRLWIFELNPRFGGSLCRYFFSFLKCLE